MFLERSGTESRRISFNAMDSFNLGVPPPPDLRFLSDNRESVYWKRHVYRDIYIYTCITFICLLPGRWHSNLTRLCVCPQVASALRLSGAAPCDTWIGRQVVLHGAPFGARVDGPGGALWSRFSQVLMRGSGGRWGLHGTERHRGEHNQKRER